MPPLALADEAQLELKALVARRRQLSGFLVAETNRRERAPKVVRKSFVRSIRGLKKALAAVEQQLRQVVQNSPAQSAKAKLMTAVPGVGPQLSVTLIAELPELGRLGLREIAALLGVAPHAHESGPFKGRRLIWGVAPASAPCSTWLRSAPCAITRCCAPATNEFATAILSRYPMVWRCAGHPKKLAVLRVDGRCWLGMTNSRFDAPSRRTQRGQEKDFPAVSNKCWRDCRFCGCHRKTSGDADSPRWTDPSHFKIIGAIAPRRSQPMAAGLSGCPLFEQ
jgi:hypothetical protein